MIESLGPEFLARKPGALGQRLQLRPHDRGMHPAVERALRSGIPSLVNVVVRPGASPLAEAMIARRTRR